MSDNKQSKSKQLNSKVLEFKEGGCAEVLTEREINNLFLGFVNLIKKNIVFEKEHRYKNEIKYCNVRINEYIIEINKKNDEIVYLKKQLQLLKNKTAA